MTVHLSKDLERFIISLVDRGRFASVDEAMAAAAHMLLGHQGPACMSATEADIHRHMLEIGLLSRLPETAADHDNPNDQPIAIEGEPLSETVIRERR